MEKYVLLKNDEVVFIGDKPEAERRYTNALSNQKYYQSNFKYELITEEEYKSR